MFHLRELQKSPKQQTLRVRRPSLNKTASGQIVATEGSFSAASGEHILKHRDSIVTVASSVSIETLEKLDITPLHSPRNSFMRVGSVEQLNLPTAFSEDSIGVWRVPLDGDDENQSIEAYLTKFRSDYLRRIDDVRKKLRVFFGVRLQNDPNLPSNRRYSLLNPLTGYMFASGKRPPTKSKTNASNLCSGHIARRRELQEKKVNPLDNSIPGAWPDDIKDAPADLKLTLNLRATVKANITAAKMWHNLVCWEEKLPEYCQMGDEYYELGRNAPKYFIQEAIPLYRLINKITRKTGPKPESGTFEFVSASSKHLTFKYNHETFEINLNLLMPPTNLPDKDEAAVPFADIEEFHEYANNIGILTHHAPLFQVADNGDRLPEMVWCDKNGHITGDADLQVVGKRFDMPSVFYSVFWGEDKEDHIKFIVGLVIAKKRLECKTAKEFREFLDSFDIQAYAKYAAPNTDPERLAFNKNDYVSDWELYNDAHYINYADESDSERFMYYQGNLMFMLDKTINRYLEKPHELNVVCHSDLYSLVVNTEIDFDNLAIHAPEDTNQHPGEVGAVLCFDTDENTYATENSVSHLMALLADRKTLEEQVIGINPAYLLTDEFNGELSQLWLDILLIRCLNAALWSDFEFERHWNNIVRVFSKDRTNGPPACAKVNERMDAIRTELNRIEHEYRVNFGQGTFDEQQLEESIKFRKGVYISQQLDKIYGTCKPLRILFKEKLYDLAEKEEEEQESVHEYTAESEEKKRVTMPELAL